MIVCVCNRLKESSVRNAARAGAASADEVYTHCGVERNCGRCQDEIELILDEEQAPAGMEKAA
ncbi:MAG: (2Fe-2S)-binding protein [Alphaproteobacteria bacterium]|jgi:bacterioferritin-associated ferredoxin|nr:(2Fe-2S)-binding protein [Alphaproteobacteria bacterium]MBN9591380.1 (2Fe-2S)-binding protein [Alphaproteobacteria bacterium]